MYEMLVGRVSCSLVSIVTMLSNHGSLRLMEMMMMNCLIT